MNSVNLLGRLTHDPERRTTDGGTPVTSFRLAVPRPKDRNGDERPPVYIDVSAFGPLAEVCGQYLAKGRQVSVAGRLDHQEWTAQDGPRRQRIWWWPTRSTSGARGARARSPRRPSPSFGLGVAPARGGLEAVVPPRPGAGSRC